MSSVERFVVTKAEENVEEVPFVTSISSLLNDQTATGIESIIPHVPLENDQ